MRSILLLLASLSLAQAAELHDAARECDVDRLQELLSTSPNVNEPGADGRPPLHVAIDASQVECVRLLMAAGADRLARDADGRTAFRAGDAVADQRDQIAIRLYLLGSGGRPAQILPAQAPPTEPPPWSLEYAVLHGQTPLVKMLLDMRVDPNTVGTKGTTPLADAALKGNAAAVRLLLEAGARPHDAGAAGSFPIHDAALGGSAAVIRELAAHGADLNARTQDEGGQTPLHLAAEMGKTEAVEALVALGADPALEDSKGRTPLEAAERYHLDGIAEILRRAAAAP